MRHTCSAYIMLSCTHIDTTVRPTKKPTKMATTDKGLFVTLAARKANFLNTTPDIGNCKSSHRPKMPSPVVWGKHRSKW
jgi:hypothetical protein